MRMPLLVDGYSLTIVSGEFNEWIWKTASTDSDYSDVFQPEQVGFEYAKVQHLFYSQLEFPEHCGIAWFVGGQEISLPGTLGFLKRHLRSP